MHPCFNAEVQHKHSRIHLPVAAGCNISCKYCNIKYDCLHESRPGVTSDILTPEEALERYIIAKNKLENIKVVGIAGPGDPLHDFEKTIKTFELIRKQDGNILFCLSTNGLMLYEYADELLKSGISHITMTINAVDTKISSGIYKHINYQGNIIKGEEGAKILLEKQIKALKYLSSKNVLLKVNIVAIKGLNINHISEVVSFVKGYGAHITNIMPLIPASGSEFEGMPLISNREIKQIREKCAAIMPQMTHCKQCRADAAGLIGTDRSVELRKKHANDEFKDFNKDLMVAVATSDGEIIDRHFGQAEEFFIYKSTNNRFKLVEKRVVSRYCTGVENCNTDKNRLNEIIKILNDCDKVICLRIGTEPRNKLENSGIDILEMYDTVENALYDCVNNL